MPAVWPAESSASSPERRRKGTDMSPAPPGTENTLAELRRMVGSDLNTTLDWLAGTLTINTGHGYLEVMVDEDSRCRVRRATAPTTDKPEGDSTVAGEGLTVDQ